MRIRRRITSVNPITPQDQDIFDKALEKGPAATCFFNNKGGVGKTTLVANLAAELSINFDAKILVVDCDPQCNLTQYVLSEERTFEIYSSSNPRGVYEVLRPISQGMGYIQDIPIVNGESFRFDLVIGDPRLALQEDLLAQDWRDAKSGGMRGLRTTFIFADLVKKAKSMNYDFVFFDMGPSLGAINRSILLTMDYFVVPMAIDIFSLWAIKNIGDAVNIWQKSLKAGIELSEDPSDIMPIINENGLKFLGYVTQQHKERSVAADPDDEDLEDIEKRRKIVRAYKEISDEFPAKIQEHLGHFYNSSINPHLGDIRHLGSLAPKSQSQHEPMIALRATGNYTNLRKQARDIYRNMAVRYLQNLAAS